MQRLAGKVALVTGGARGIGLAIARRFAREGAAAVILADIDGAEAERVAPENPAFHPCSLDVTRDEDWTRAVDRTVARHGGLDVLVNNAGIAVVGTIESVTLEDWRRVQDINVDGTFLGCRHAVRAMKPPAGRGGAIINLSSVAGRLGFPLRTPYAATKWAVVGLTKSLAMELGPHGINVNSVAQGFVLTPMTGTSHSPKEVEEHIEARKKMAARMTGPARECFFHGAVQLT